MMYNPLGIDVSSLKDKDEAGLLSEDNRDIKSLVYSSGVNKFESDLMKKLLRQASQQIVERSQIASIIYSIFMQK